MQRSDDLRRDADRPADDLDPRIHDESAPDRPREHPDPERGDALDPERGDAFDPDPLGGAATSGQHAGPDDTPAHDRPGADPDTAIGVAEVPSTDATAPPPVEPYSRRDADTVTEPAGGPDRERDFETPPASQPDQLERPYDAGVTGEQPVPRQDTTPPEVAREAAAPTAGPVLGDRVAEFRGRWREVQASFVDDPAVAVRDADVLLTEVIDAFSSALGDRQRGLGDSWRDTPDTGTEELRGALMRYRAVVQKLLDA
jgi:hypothetical protein